MNKAPFSVPMHPSHQKQGSPRSRGRRLVAAVGVLGLTLQSAVVLIAGAAPIPESRVGIRMDSFLLDGAYSIVSGQPTGDGQMGNGRIGRYPEGACLPVLIEVTNNDNVAGDVVLTPVFDHFDETVGISDFRVLTTSLSDPRTQADDLNDYAFSGAPLTSVTSFETNTTGTVSAVVTGPFSGETGTTALGATDATGHYTITLTDIPVDVTTQVLFCAQFGMNATEYGPGMGASMSIRVGSRGAENIAVRAQDLMALPSLTLQKIVVGGTATSDQWSFNVTPAIGGVSNFSIPSGQDRVVIPNVILDGAYSITESGPSGYSFSTGTGTNCGFSGSVASSTIAAGNPAVDGFCTFTNVADPVVPPQLTVTKVVVNDDGGSMTTSSFPLFVDGTPVMSGVANAYSTGTHAVTETNQTGYVGTFSGDCDVNGNVTLVSGDVKTCLLTNDDVAAPTSTVTTATLMVVKQVVNDNGGTNVAGDFTMSVTGTNPSLTSFPGSASGTAVILDAGVYAVDEVDALGYTKTLDSNCAGTILAGEVRTCTVTNDDPMTIPPATTGTLIVVKQVVNDDGGTSIASDFTMSVSSTGAAVMTFPGSTSGTTLTINAGAYSVDEVDALGYVKTTSTDCVGTLAVGETRTCTITNDDQEPVVPPATTSTLTVIKQVTNDDGGTRVASDFTMSVSSTAGVVTFPGSASGTLVVVPAGPYQIGEVDALGYIQVLGADCSGTIAVGETKSCTVFNNDPGIIVPPPPIPTTGVLRVTKLVVNDQGGTLASSDFTIHVSGTTPSMTTFAGSASGTSITLGAGAYAVTEDAVSGYAASSVSAGCSGTMLVGSTLDCVIVNDDIGSTSTSTSPTSTLIVIKLVVNDNGWTNVASNFTMTATGTNISLTSFPGSASGTILTLSPGAYKVNEVDGLGYHRLVGSTCSGTIAAGETVTCIVTNDDPAPLPPPTGGGGGGGSPAPTPTPTPTPVPTPTPTPTPNPTPTPVTVISTPAPRVLGTEVTADSDATTSSTAPTPRVLGVTDELPRTGYPIQLMVLVLAPALWCAARRKNVA